MRLRVMRLPIIYPTFNVRVRLLRYKTDKREWERLLIEAKAEYGTADESEVRRLLISHSKALVALMRQDCTRADVSRGMDWTEQWLDELLWANRLGIRA